MHEVTFPSAEPAIVQTDLAVRIPTRMVNPSTQIKNTPRHGEGPLPLRELPGHDLIGQFDTETFIGVHTQDPVIPGLLRREIFLL